MNVVRIYFLLMLLLSAAPSIASKDVIGPDTKTSDEWHYVIAFPMVWAPSIDGSITSELERVDLTVPFDDILENLNWGIIGELYAQKGPWLYSLRLDFMRVKGESVTEGLTGPITGGIISPGHVYDIKLDMAANDFLAGYEVLPGFRVFTGVRQIYAKLDVDVSPRSDDGLINISKNLNIAHDNDFDWLVGMTYRHWFSDNWGMSVGFDTKIAGESDRDNGFNVTAMYRFGELHNIWIGYRYLHIGNDVKKDDIVERTDFKQQGPQLGWAFTF
ncbi:hypothetical protein [Thalassotalea agarivorans]|uniref:Outer membrane protein beta-barrel domain-containing protein n=1 Tax=Thalassotalea agarivorans TaxID=349064 RepID=A0A1I0AMU6_THASX|nr:hypothetical protein [Thalassotalea agarivorans]SES94709.1 hypothetical protein SAMN05660429_00736 [Thalassotalea agarivorans]